LSPADAVRNILRYHPDARFIVMLRNPVDMAPALHTEMSLAGHETVRSFTAAGRLPPFSWAARRLLYGEVCRLDAQLERLLRAVPAGRVLAIALDDVISDSRREYLRVLRFLGVGDDGRTTFAAYNKSGVSRWPALGRAMFAAIQIKRQLGITRGLNLWKHVADINSDREAARAVTTRYGDGAGRLFR
jgi:hypothetical protein